MRKSKPAAMCLKLQDINNWLFPSSHNGEAYSPWASNFQREPDGFNTIARLNELGDLVAFIPRVDCETDFDYLQLLPYAVVMTHDGRIVGYNRPTKGGGEVRLAGNFSIGFGGHVELGDAMACRDYPDLPNLIVDAALARELEEEINLRSEGELSRWVCPPSCVVLNQEAQFLGIIRSQDSAVDRVHLGLVYLVRCNTKGMPNLIATTPEPNQVINPRLLTLEQARAEANPESWTAKILNSNLLWDEV